MGFIERRTVSQITCNEKSASGAGSTEIPAGWAPAQSDHSPPCGNAVCSPGTAPSFAQRHAQEGTESAPTHHRADGKDGHKSEEGRVARETGYHKPSLSPFTTPQMTLGLNPLPQIRPALLIERRSVPALIPAAVIQTSIPAFTQSGIGMVRMWPPLPTRSAMTQCSSLCCMSSTRSAVNSARRRPQPSRMANVA